MQHAAVIEGKQISAFDGKHGSVGIVSNVSSSKWMDSSPSIWSPWISFTTFWCERNRTFRLQISLDPQKKQLYGQPRKAKTYRNAWSG